MAKVHNVYIVVYVCVYIYTYIYIYTYVCTYECMDPMGFQCGRTSEVDGAGLCRLPGLRLGLHLRLLPAWIQAHRV